ncbi:hypothetical protein B0J14DRAFT_247648 [Halenospora varia]|nr:hypothetical protein B0J14DRAFT_247648 [Halenospora varia]
MDDHNHPTAASFQRDPYNSITQSLTMAYTPHSYPANGLHGLAMILCISQWSSHRAAASAKIKVLARDRGTELTMLSLRSHTLKTPLALRPYRPRRLLSTTVANRANAPRDRPSQPTYEGGDLGGPVGEEAVSGKLGGTRNSSTLLTIGGIGLAVGSYFAFRTGRHKKAEKAAGANDEVGKT